MYRLSKIIPVRFRSTYRVIISDAEVVEGGHGNHFASPGHTDRESATWWQWRGRVFRQRTVRVCA